MDNELFWKLLEPVHPMAAAFCQKLAGDRDEGNDLYQDALLTAMRHLRTLRDHTAFKAWLFKIIINSHKNRFRSFWFRRRVPANPEMLESLAGYDPGSQYDSRRLLQMALDFLAPDVKALVVLHELEGWPTAELATMFRKPEGTIKNRIFRAKQTMREKLEKMLPKPSEQILDRRGLI